MIDCFRNSTIFVIYSPNSAAIARLGGRKKDMEMDMNAMKAEMGGAFVVSWLILGAAGSGFGSLEGAVVLAAAWMAFSGAHILPVVTWCHMMTGDLGDVEGNWMANGMRLLAQIVGAVLAVLLMTEAGAVETTWAANAFEAPDLWGALGMIAAGAIFWTVHTRCDSAWVSGFAAMALFTAMGMTYGGVTAEGVEFTLSTTGANEMAAMMLDGFGSVGDVAPTWIVDGLLVGIGAFVAGQVDDLL
jgi:hypothetical protein